jgi:Ser/Thr protein kinase RdoA (MazF antagonist)
MGGFEDSAVVTKPRWTPDQAGALVRQRYGLTGSVRELPSERDQNFKISAADGRRFVLKISNPREDRRVLDLQDAALRHLRAGGIDLGTPEPIAVDGETIFTASGQDGTDHPVRLLSWVPGRPLAQIRRSPDQLEPLGRFLARLDQRLAAFDHPAEDREFYWDLRRGLDVTASYVAEIEDSHQRRRIERLLLRISDRKTLFDGLEQQVIHGDANDYNVVVDESSRGSTIGLIDFGDMGRSWRVADLAILLAYAMLDQSEPLVTAARITAGYHSVLPLAEAEIEALFPLAHLRICTSVAVAAHQRKQAPDNTYLGVTEGPAWRLLDRLDGIDSGFAERTLRTACGLPLDLRERRRQRLGSALSLAYDQPLTIVRGSGAYLYDPDGNDYLDCVNNVCHVGHAREEVVFAAANLM